MGWRPYVPAVVVGATTAACILGSNSINARRNAALISMYTLADGMFKDYKEKVVEIVGAQKEQKVRDEVAKDRIDNDPVSSKQVIITGNGDVLCYDTLSGRYFNSNVESLRKAMNDINYQCNHEMYASQNDFYRAIGLPINGYGEEMGWNTDVNLELEFSTVMSDDSRPCISIAYRMAPIRGYSSLR